MSDSGPAARDGVIEQHSIDYVPNAERHGKVWHQGPFWFTGNFVLPTMVVGFIGPTMGLSVGFSVLASALGAAFGTFFMAFHANQGPRMGLPQMIQSRAQFGSRGSIVPFAATVFVYVGFLVFDTILATQGLRPVPGRQGVLVSLLIVAVSIVIAVIGHDLLHVVQRWLTYLLVVVFAIITVIAVVHFSGRPPLPAADGAPLGWTTAGFLVQFSLAAGYNIPTRCTCRTTRATCPRTRRRPADHLGLRRCRTLGGLADVAGRDPRQPTSRRPTRWHRSVRSATCSSPASAPSRSCVGAGADLDHGRQRVRRDASPAPARSTGSGK